MALEIGFGLATLIVLAAIAYGVVQYGRRNPRNEAETDRATRELYRTTEL